MGQDNVEMTAKSKKRFRILVLFCVLGGIILKMSFVLFFIGMFPAMVAYLVDHDKDKYTSSTVAALNFAGVFPYMVDIFMRGGNFSVVREKLSDITVWFVMYGAAGLGWAIVYFSPIIAAVALDGIYKGRILHLEMQQKKAVEEWGQEITGVEEDEV